MNPQKYKIIQNKFGRIDLYLCETKDGKYILGIPEHMKDNAEMFVEAYNSGGRETDTYLENVQHAITDKGNPIEKTYKDFITDFPMVIPIIPCLKGKPDSQQLSLDSIKEFNIHEKTKDCIEEAKVQIEEITGKKVQDKIFLSGYSASGLFAQRFAFIYPELINRALIGGAAGTIPVPTKMLKYPIGIQDYAELFGKEFNSEAYKQIQFGYYVAEKEATEPGSFDINGDRIHSDKQIAAPMHDMSFRSVTTEKDVGIRQRQILGKTLDERYKNAIKANKLYGVDIEGIIVSGSTHKEIHNEEITPAAKYLKEQFIKFYSGKKQLDPNYQGCCARIDNSFQESREDDKTELFTKEKFMGKENEIISFFKNQVNETNIEHVILKIKTTLNESGKEATKHVFEFGDGSSRTRTMTLGLNKIDAGPIGNVSMGGNLSSDRKFISDNIILNVVSGLGDVINSTMGDCTEAYEILIKRIQELENPTFDNVMKEVYMTTADFFGSVEQVDLNKRTEYYQNLGNLELTGKISDLKGKSIAACVERAALSQNLLKFLGYDSIYKVSQITNDESKEAHAYNLVAHNGKYYVFDATIPRIDEKGEVTPIVAEITKDAFETLAHPLKEDDVSIKTERKSVRGYRKIHYNSWSENVLDTTARINDDNEEVSL